MRSAAGKLARAFLLSAALLSPALVSATITVGDGTGTAPTSVGPGATLQVVDYFTLRTAQNGGETVNGLTVRLASVSGIAAVEIYDVTNATVRQRITNPAGTDVVFTFTHALARNVTYDYQVRIDTLGATAMPSVPGAAYTTNAYVLSVNTTITPTYQDNADGNTVIDNLSPSSPSNLSGTAGNAQVDLSWTNPGDADLGSVVVLRRASAAVSDVPTEGATYSAGNPVGASTVACVTAAPGFTCNDPGLTNETPYYYKAFARDTYGNYSATGSAAGPYTPTAPVAPSQPGAPSLSAVGATGLTATWTTSTGSPTPTYTLEKSLAGQGSWSAVTGCSGDDAPPCTGSGLSPNTSYDFRIVASSSAGSATSGTTTQLTLPDQPAMGGYTNVGGTSLTVNWTMAGTTTGLTYDVQRAPDSGGSPGPFAAVAACQDLPATTTTCNDGGLATNTTYWYQVQAANAAGSGAWATATSVLTKTPPTTPGTPGASGQTVSSMNVAWTPSTGATSYRLEVATDAAYSQDLHVVDPATSPQAVSGLASNTVYLMRVNATGAGGTSNWTGNGFATTKPGPPTFPASPFSGTTSSSTTVTWNAPSGNATVTSYVLDRAKDAAFSVELVTTPGIAGTSTPVSGLSASTTYWFRVRAVNATGTSLDSESRSVTTGASAATTLTSGSDPTASGPLCPGGEAAYVGQLTFTSDPSADTIRSVVAGLGAGTGAAIAALEIRDAVGAPLSPPRISIPGVPSADAVTFDLTANPLSSPLSPGATYRLYATPQSHAVMPPGSYTLVARATSFDAVTHPEGGSDGANPFAIDNQAPADAAWGTLTPGNNLVSLQWTNPNADGGASLAQIVVLRRKTASVFSEALADGAAAPGEGTTTGGGSTVVYSRAATPGATVSIDDGGVLNGNDYVYRVYAVDACGNWTAGVPSGPVQPLGAWVAEGDPTDNSPRPSVAIINPSNGAVVRVPFRVQARVFSPNALAIGTVTLDYGSGTVEMLRNDNYGTAADSGIYEARLDVFAAGGHTLRAIASNTQGSVNSRAVNVTVSTVRGDGNLLVRDNSSQLCTDCHAMKSHTSESTSNKRGSWAMACRDCHAPHGTKNIMLVNERITPPALAGAQAARDVVFYSRSDMARGDKKGVCQVCHTQTDFYRQDGSGAAHETGNDCKKCHSHGQGLAATCTQCHGDAARLKNPLVIGTVDTHLAAAPPDDADEPANPANDALRVGAHEAHVNQTTYREDALFCADCHPSATSHQGTRDAAWSALATRGGAVTPSPAAATGYDATWESSPTCSNYCHGATLTGGTKPTPSWTAGYTAPGTEATCGSCHGKPPPVSATPGEDHPQNAKCYDCHGLGYTTTTVAKASHVDGVFDGPEIGCTACHGELAGPKPAAAEPNTNLASAPGYSATAVTTHGDVDPGAHDAHVRPTNATAQNLMGAKSCEVCHGELPASGTKTHANGTVLIGWNTPASAESVSPTWNGTSCTNYCHSDAKPLGASDATKVQVAWGDSLTFGCTSCHGDGAAGPALSSRHAKHLAAPYAFGCKECHAATAASNTSLADPSLHVNGTKNWRFSATFQGTIDQAAGTYAGYTCSGTYCHSPGTKTSGFDAPVGTALSWSGGSTSLSCDDCHGGSSSATHKLATGSHTGHVNNPALQTQYGCVTCHSATVTDDTHVKASAPHVNGAKEVSAASWNGTTCGANSCHSDGKGSYVTTPPTWGVDTLGCNGCHGVGSTLGAPNYANGGVDVLRSNSHAKHIGSDPIVCKNCHPDTTTDGTSVNSNHLNGTINVRLDPAFAGAGATYTPRSGNTSPSCSNLSGCHANVKWGGTLTEGPCSGCHLADAAPGNQDLDDLGRWNGTPAWIDRDDWLLTGHGRPTAFSDAGQSGNAAPNFPVTTTPVVEGCYYCHAPKEAISGGTQTSIHNDPLNNPFRLANVNWNGKGKNGVCLVCHDANTADGLLGFDPDGGNTVYGIRKATAGARVSATHYGSDHAGAGKGGELCWDCHDPHGDFNYTAVPNRLIAYMIHERPVRTHELVASNGWGLPDPTELATNTVDFSAAVSGSASAFEGTDYAETGATGPYNGVCQVCHTATNEQRWDGTNRGHMTGAQCTTCHPHSRAVATEAFVEATACDGCHSSNPSASGEHLIHVGAATPAYGDAAPRSTAGAYAYGCGKCHATTGATPAVHFNFNAGGTTTTPYQADVVFDWASGTTPYTPGSASNDPGPTGLVFRTTTGTCATYCHSNGGPLQSGGTNATPTYASPTWNSAETVSCTSCHGYGDTPGTMSAPHSKHIRTNANNAYNYPCLECHQPTTTSAVDPIITDKSKHVDGVNDQVAFRSALNPSGSYGTGNFTCSSVYCHSDGQPYGAASPTYKSPKWTDGAMAAGCIGCHGGNAGTGASAIATNKHGQHINQSGVLGTNYGCVDCHNATVSGDTTILSTSGYAQHVDGGAKDVGFPARPGGQTSGAYASPNCASNYCHSNGRDPGFTDASRYTTVAWNGSAIGCTGCHGKSGTTAAAPDYPDDTSLAGANSHVKHIGATPSAATCKNCHSGYVTTDGTAISGSSHTDGFRNVGILSTYDTDADATNNYVSGTKTCSSVKCHGTNDVIWGGGAMTCTSCHGTSRTIGSAVGAGDTNLSAAPPKDTAGNTTGNTVGPHVAHIAPRTADPEGQVYLPIKCAECHTNAVNSYATGHMNGTQDVSFLDAAVANLGGLSAQYTDGSPGTCASTYCHGGGFTAAFKGSITTWNWGTAQTTTCGSCHGLPPDAGAGGTHNGVGTTAAACNECHQDTVDVNGKIIFTGSGASATTLHINGTLDGGGSCIGCHTNPKDDPLVAGSRRAVKPDFSLKSHHVGNAGAIMGGVMTDNDCAVCHAEATVAAQGGDVTATTGLHKNGLVDLRSSDSNTTYYEYDTNNIKTIAVGSANSGNATWKQQMAGQTTDTPAASPSLACTGTVPSGYTCLTGLDRFCLTCHDANGANAAYQKGDASVAAGTASAMNPFADAKITNEYDQQVRKKYTATGTIDTTDTVGRVVDVASRVDQFAPVTATGGTAGPVNRDIAAAPAEPVGTTPTRISANIPDPPEGVFSRHAIRGLSVSPYTSATSTWDTTTFWTSTLWRSNSVMGCADCHTVDAVNGANGNAHGAQTEYMLKSADGTSATVANTNTTVNCAMCHVGSQFVGGVHTNSTNDFQWTAGTTTLTSRLKYAPPSTNTDGGSVFGYACGNCHGGGSNSKTGVTFPNGSQGRGGFGTIHGTSQIIGIGTSGGGANRNAYRFTNGNSMRYYDPADWMATTRQCYTLSTDTGDGWGACSKHSGGQALNETSAMQRKLQY